MHPGATRKEEEATRKYSKEIHPNFFEKNFLTGGQKDRYLRKIHPIVRFLNEILSRRRWPSGQRRLHNIIKVTIDSSTKIANKIPNFIGL
jgi:hypothetical protein